MTATTALEKLIEVRKKCTTQEEWFAGTPTDKKNADCGLCQVDDGQTHGMFPVTCEWHEGRFIAQAANFATDHAPDLLKRVRQLEDALRNITEPGPFGEPLRTQLKMVDIARAALGETT